jgi:hypothetical protein
MHCESCAACFLKCNGLAEIARELWPIAVFTLVIAVIAIWCYRETLD